MFNKAITVLLLFSFIFSNYAHAGNPISTIIKKFKNAVNDCTWDPKKEEDMVKIRTEMLNTPYPEMAYIVPFKESDFQEKPYLREFKYVVVVNNANPYLNHTQLSSKQDVNSLVTSEMTPAAFDFFRNIQLFGSPIYQNGKYLLSRIQGAQTARIYENGHLIRVTPISTGRGIFELKAKQPVCNFRPATSYYSYTESGYYTFQELIKDYESNDYDADMPNAMFYDRSRGLALHEVFKKEKINALGTRASGGCTRMDPNTAATLYEAIKSTQGATIPVIKRDGSVELLDDGSVARKNNEVFYFKNGKKSVQPTYSALLIIQPDPVVSLDPVAEMNANFHYIQDEKQTVDESL